MVDGYRNAVRRGASSFRDMHDQRSAILCNLVKSAAESGCQSQVQMDRSHNNQV